MQVEGSLRNPRLHRAITGDGGAIFRDAEELPQVEGSEHRWKERS